MANRDAPKGFRPVACTIGGGVIQCRRYKVDSSESSAIYPGDMLTREADGNLSRTITPGTTPLIGVSAFYSPASTEMLNAPVFDQPGLQFVGQADGSLAEADMGLNANFIKGTGNATLKQSRDEINSATEADTATLDLRLIQKFDAPNNDWGAYVQLEVLINKHLLHPRVDGI